MTTNYQSKHDGLGEYDYSDSVPPKVIHSDGPLTLESTGLSGPHYVVRRHGQTIRNIHGGRKYAERVWRKLRRRVR